MAPLPERAYKFGQFLIDLEQRVLLRDGQQVPITKKTLEVLQVLIEGRESVMKREELMSILWPHGGEDNNLDKHISKLRDAFGDRFHHKSRHIKTYPRYGFQFVAKLDDWPGREKEVSALDPAETHEEAKEISAPDPVVVVEETVVVSPNRKNPVRKIRWWLWLGLGLSLAGLGVILFVWLRPTPKPKIPEILSITPTFPLATIGDQKIILIGRNFQKEPTVKITFPSGGSANLQGAQVQPGTETSMVVLADFNCHPGKYKLEVINPDGQISVPFSFEAIKHFQSPIIEAVVPESPEAIKEEQYMVVYGHNFGHAVIVEVIFPNGKSAKLLGSQIFQRTPTAMTIRILFDGKPGIYKLRATNPDGDWSAPFPFTAH